MKHVFIVGSKGIPANYGGYETFVENLTKRKIDTEIQYHIACLGNEEQEYVYNDAHCFQVKVPSIGPARAVLADIYALKYIIKFVKMRKIVDFNVLVLACRIGIVFKKYVKKIHKLNGKVYVNPDGHEWLRSKWSKPIKMYWKYSEKKMVKRADLLICDSLNIEKYILKNYKKYNPKTIYIAYGADLRNSFIEKEDKWVENWMTKFHIRPSNYFLVVGRFVPENNYETIIREFMKTSISKDLVLVTNYENNKFFDFLKKKLSFQKDERIKFVGTVYQEEYIKRIREAAFGYIHGHSVGGTNPSLLEALSSTKLNLLYDCGFNKEVAGDSALYWSLEDNSLCDLLEKCNNFEEEVINNYDLLSSQVIREKYNWDSIVSKYEMVLKK